MKLPAELQPVLDALATVGRPRLVGGCVRDWLLGAESDDFDIEVAGTDFGDLHRVLAPFGATDVVGRSFGVIKLHLKGRWYDFALPRRESKTGAGHRGFAIEPDPTLSDAEAAARRDFTINAIAYDPFARRLIDPHNGVADLRAGILRHTSPAFVEDPLRVLRAFQLAARFDLRLAPETTVLCRKIHPTGHELAVERIWGEWAKWAEKSVKPSAGLLVLKETGWLTHFPELAALDGCPQEPEWHPEGDAFVHTSHCCDALAALPEWRAAPPRRRRLLMIAVLAHDLGKATTTARTERRGILRWTSNGHEAAGVAPTEAFLRRIGAPLDHAPFITPLVAHHLAHHHGQDGTFSDQQVRRLARKLSPATIDDLCLVMLADARGRPPLDSVESETLIEKLRERALELALRDSAPKPILQGRHLITYGLRPGPAFSGILEAAFDAQIDGAFMDESTAFMWLSNYLQNQRPSGA
ncbi:MAG: HD domain-containing protein [Verrucomicrobiota bacterium]